MNSPSEASQHDDVMVQTAHQLTASMERVRLARALLFDASDRLSQTRQEVEKDQRLERVRRARELLHGETQELTLARLALLQTQGQDAQDPARDDATERTACEEDDSGAP
jgi:hypothetical protein